MAISLYSELRREWLLWKAYRVNAISSLVMWGIIFPILMLTVQSAANYSGVAYGREQLAESLIGFIVWKLCMGVLVAIPAMIEEETRTGTLENILLSTFMPFHTLFFFRILARSLRSLLETVLLAVALMFLFRLPLFFPPTAWVVILLTLAGVWGVGYLMAGLALIHKAVSSVTSLLANLAFLISGAMIPLDSLGMLYTALKLVFPMTWGIEILRDVVLNGTTLMALVQSGVLVGLALQTTLFLVFGLIIFNYSMRQVRRTGELGSY
jgi:ABC-2 type transport system permease protein